MSEDKIKSKCIDCGEFTFVTQTSPKDSDLKYGLCDDCSGPKVEKCGCVYMEGLGDISRCYDCRHKEGEEL